MTLSTLEIVLGVDNLVFISVSVSRLPEARRSRARRIGLALACVTRILLLLSLVHLASLDDRSGGLFDLIGQVISVRDLVMIGGGIFLVVKGIMEIHDSVWGDHGVTSARRAPAVYGVVIAQIALIDIVFSLDSVITAVGMANNVGVMIAAILVAVAIMLLAADPVGHFIDNNPTVKMLALAFIVLVGIVLILDGFQVHVPRGYIYFAMAFSAAVETLNLWAKRKAA